MKLFGFHHHHHDRPFEDAPPWAVEIREILRHIIKTQETTMSAITDLQAAVARETDAEDSVITLLKGISQQLKDAQAANDPAAIAAVIASIDANTQKLSAAVVENTQAG